MGLGVSQRRCVLPKGHVKGGGRRGRDEKEACVLTCFPVKNSKVCVCVCVRVFPGNLMAPHNLILYDLGIFWRGDGECCFVPKF